MAIQDGDDSGSNGGRSALQKNFEVRGSFWESALFSFLLYGLVVGIILFCRVGQSSAAQTKKHEQLYLAFLIMLVYSY